MASDQTSQTSVVPRSAPIKGAVPVDQMRDMATIVDNGEIGEVEVSAITAMNKKFLDVKPNLMLFDKKLRDDDDRFDRLEGAVQGIHNDLGKLTPSINRLIAIETDIKELHDKLVTLIDGKDEPTMSDTSSAQPRTTTLDNKTATSPPKKAEAAKPPNPITPLKPLIRLSEAKDKTRIVFETPNKETFQVSYDNDNKIINVTTAQNFTKGELEKIVKKSSQVTEYSITPQSNGYMIALAVNDNVRSVSDGSHLSPKAAGLSHRYYFDIFK